MKWEDAWGQGEGEEKKEVRLELSCMSDSESVPRETKGEGRVMSTLL